jgi:hypothetical protein
MLECREHPLSLWICITIDLISICPFVVCERPHGFKQLPDAKVDILEASDAAITPSCKKKINI